MDRGQKIKFTDTDESNFKRQRVNTYPISYGKKYQRPSFNRRADYRQRDENARSSTATSNIISDSTNSFRIPKKSNKWLGKDEV